jgi:photosystem II stability/assembly factor-like uncharacterized protein
MKKMLTRRGLLVLLAVAAVAGSGGFYVSGAFSQGMTTIAALAKETHFHGIAADVSDSSRVYLATHHGLYVTGRDGRAQRISEVRDYMGFTVHPTDATVLFASGHPAGGGNLGFIVSRDGGRTWTKLSDGVGGPVDFHQMDVSKADPRVLYGVYQSLQRSTDGGQTWQVVGPAPADIIALAASSIDLNTLYAATQNGLLQSSDAGKSWKRHLDRPTTMAHVTHEGTVYAFVVGMGLVRASEKNLVWRVVGKGFGDRILLHLAGDPRDSQRLYAVAHNSKTRTQGVITSRDGGEQWKILGAD